VTINAYVRATFGDPPHTVVDRHPVEVIQEAESRLQPTIVDVPGFGLYAVGVHPAYGVFANYLIPTPGAVPKAALCELVDGRFEVRLIRKRLHLVVEGHPLARWVPFDRSCHARPARLPFDGAKFRRRAVRRSRA
jgi:hypothetical protein